MIPALNSNALFTVFLFALLFEPRLCQQPVTIEPLSADVVDNMFDEKRMVPGIVFGVLWFIFWILFFFAFIYRGKKK